VLSAALRLGVRIVSLNPVKMSLEDYFLARIEEPPHTAAEQDLSAAAHTKKGER